MSTSQSSDKPYRVYLISFDGEAIPIDAFSNKREASRLFNDTKAKHPEYSLVVNYV